MKKLKKHQSERVGAFSCYHYENNQIKMKSFKKSASLILAFALAFSVLAFPDTSQALSPRYVACINLESNLSFGQKGYGSDIMQLQYFLQDQGHLNGRADGIFGSQTRAAVISFQKSKGIVPAAGFVGPVTRKAIKDMPCSGADASLNNFTVPAPCSSRELFNYRDGTRCGAGSALPASVCPAGAAFNIMTGEQCGIGDGQLTSLRLRGTEAMIQNLLSNMRPQAELYYAVEGNDETYTMNPYGWSNGCLTTKGTLFTTDGYGLGSLVNGVRDHSAGSQMMCYADASGWSVSVVHGASTYCVDSTGYVGTTTAGFSRVLVDRLCR